MTKTHDIHWNSTLRVKLTPWAQRQINAQTPYVRGTFEQLAGVFGQHCQPGRPSPFDREHGVEVDGIQRSWFNYVVRIPNGDDVGLVLFVAMYAFSEQLSGRHFVGWDLRKAA